MCCSIDPPKDNAPLVVDANTMEPPPLAPQSLETVPGRGSKVQESVSTDQHIELAHRHRHDIAWKGPRPPSSGPVVEIRSRLVTERRDHPWRLTLTRNPCNPSFWLPNGPAISGVE